MVSFKFAIDVLGLGCDLGDLDFLAGQRLTAFLADPLGGNSAARQDGQDLDGGGGGALHLSPTAAQSEFRICSASKRVLKFDCGSSCYWFRIGDFVSYPLFRHKLKKWESEEEGFGLKVGVQREETKYLQFHVRCILLVTNGGRRASRG